MAEPGEPKLKISDPEIQSALERFPIGKKFIILTRVYRIAGVKRIEDKIQFSLKGENPAYQEQSFNYPNVPSSWKEIEE